MRRSTLIMVGYACFGGVFLINAVTGAGFRPIAAVDTDRRMITWGVLGGVWLLISAYAVVAPEQFDVSGDAPAEGDSGYAVMFSAVFVLLLILSIGVVINLGLRVL